MELLAPAGNVDKLRYCYTYGADAAYIGLKNFSLRIKADNFYEDEYKKVLELKKNFPGRRLHCALNISFHNEEIDRPEVVPVPRTGGRGHRAVSCHLGTQRTRNNIICFLPINTAPTGEHQIETVGI